MTIEIDIHVDIDINNPSYALTNPHVFLKRDAGSASDTRTSSQIRGDLGEGHDGLFCI